MHSPPRTKVPIRRNDETSESPRRDARRRRHPPRHQSLDARSSNRSGNLSRRQIVRIRRIARPGVTARHQMGKHIPRVHQHRMGTHIHCRRQNSPQKCDALTRLAWCRSISRPSRTTHSFCGRAGTMSSTMPDLTASHRFTRRSTTTSHKCTLYATHSPQSYRATSANPLRTA